MNIGPCIVNKSYLMEAREMIKKVKRTIRQSSEKDLDSMERMGYLMMTADRVNRY